MSARTAVESHDALRGIRVVELTHAIAGPHAGQMLADHGADVIKIEPPDGEMSRTALPLLEGASLYFATHNRGKRSVCLNLKDSEAVAALQELVRTADVVLTNYGEGVPERLGWSYEVLSRVNPRLVMAHITGFGHGADWAPRGAYDGVIQAMSGLADLTGTKESGPMFVGAFVADHVAAYHAVTGILLALRERDLSGEGAFVDISMLSSYQTMLAHDVGLASREISRPRAGNQVQTAFANLFSTRDGSVFIAPLAQAAWKRFWSALGEPETADAIPYDAATDPLHREPLERRVQEWAGERTTAQVHAVLDAAAVPHGPLNTVAEAVAEMASHGREMVVTVDAPGGHQFQVPGRPIAFGQTSSRRALIVPELGEHTREVLEPVLGPDRAARLGALGKEMPCL